MQTSMSFRHQKNQRGVEGVGLARGAYDVGSKFVRGGIIVAAVIVVVLV